MTKPNKIILNQTQSKQIKLTKLNQTKPKPTKPNHTKHTLPKPIKPYQHQPNHTNTTKTKSKPTKPNRFQPSILKDLRCPKVLRNSCADPYLLNLYVKIDWSSMFMGDRPELLPVPLHSGHQHPPQQQQPQAFQPGRAGRHHQPQNCQEGRV